MNLLIAEDRPANQAALRFLMDDWQYMADIVPDGRAVLEHLEKKHYDLCMLDVQMPEINGYQAAEYIRKHYQYLPLLMVTGQSWAEVPRDVREQIDDFLEKPFDINQLHAKITDLTIKTNAVSGSGNTFQVLKEMPMNQEEAKELRELDKKGLSKVTFSCFMNPVTVVVHKNVPQKISRDFIGKDIELTSFLDRSEERPAECYLYRKNYMLNARHLPPEKYNELLAAEDKELEGMEKFSVRKEVKGEE